MNRADLKFLGHVSLSLVAAMLVAVPWALGAVVIMQRLGWL